MLHLRIVAPRESADRVVAILESTESVCNIAVLSHAAKRPAGDMVLCDVPREDASVVLADLRGLGIHHSGSIAVQAIETELSDQMERAVEAAQGAPADAVVWEEVTKRTSGTAELSVSFALFMVLAALIAAVGIFLDSAILIVGAMSSGPSSGRSPASASPCCSAAASSPAARRWRSGSGSRWRSPVWSSLP